tara:strand:- start:481 stop:714 length:234 start_codon:yes stop_codon:yes gene_type:complete
MINRDNEYLYNNEGESYEDLELDNLFRLHPTLDDVIDAIDYTSRIDQIDYINQDPGKFTNLTNIREIGLLKEFGYWN